MRPPSLAVASGAVLDHLLVDVINLFRQSFEGALLQRQAVEERFQVDVFLGDVSWETSYSLPGEEQPPRVRVDISLDWPTWSQTAYRTWSMGETPDEPPEVAVEIAMRVQRLAAAPTADRVLASLPAVSPELTGEPLERSATTIEEVRLEPDGRDANGGSSPRPTVHWVVEAAYEGSIRLDERHLEEPDTIGPVVDRLTGWVSSTLVRLADLPFEFLPPDPVEEDD